jgi:hypothetical protein
MATRRKAGAPDRRLVVWVVGVMSIAILGFVLYGPHAGDNNPEPTTYNASSAGTKAAYLLLPGLGYSAQRWDNPTPDLRNVDAAHTTLVLTSPRLPVKNVDVPRKAIEDFLKRGGWVIATGASGALLLPEGKTAEPSNVIKGSGGLCYTTPQGDGALAKVGEIPIDAPVRWSSVGPSYRVDQRCGHDAVVVRYRVGAGQAIWWSSPMPISNAGLRNDPSLKLVLASVGPPGRTVLFDEYLHTWRDSIEDTLKGLPWAALNWQLSAVALLLLFSFSRRSGPTRADVVLPRTSPTEFAESMGALYAKAKATDAATGAARERVIESLRDQCGIPRELLHALPPSVSDELSARFGGDWQELDAHLAQASQTAPASVSAKSILKLVQALDADFQRLQQLAQRRKPQLVVNR